MIARLQRNAVIVCVLMAAVSLVLARDWWYPVAVFGGGLLAAISFVSVRGSVEGLARPGFSALKVAGRYALLGFLAYVMIARLRLPPIGLLAGASSVVAAAMIEAIGLLRTKH